MEWCQLYSDEFLNKLSKINSSSILICIIETHNKFTVNKLNGTRGEI